MKGMKRVDFVDFTAAVKWVVRFAIINHTISSMSTQIFDQHLASGIYYMAGIDWAACSFAASAQSIERLI